MWHNLGNKSRHNYLLPDQHISKGITWRSKTVISDILQIVYGIIQEKD